MLVCDHQRDAVQAFLNAAPNEPCDKFAADKMSRGNKNSDIPGLFEHRIN